MSSFKDDTDNGATKLNDDDINYYEDAFKVLDALFASNDGKELIIHQFASYEQFVNKDIGDIIRQFNTRKLYFQYDPAVNKHRLEIHIDFLNYNLGRPTINENDGSFKVMTPELARLRNLTYSSPLTINIKMTRILRSKDPSKIEPNLDLEDVKEQYFNSLYFGRIPIMVMSNNCVLSKLDGTTKQQNGECPLDFGGYFIIGGNEKVIVSQERIAENEAFVFYNAKKTKGQEIEIRCVSDQQFSVVMNNIIRYVYRDETIEYESPNFKSPVPIMLLLKCLGVKTDKQLIDIIVWDQTTDIGDEMTKTLKNSFDKYRKIIGVHNMKSTDDAETHLDVLVGYLKFKGLNKDIKYTNADKILYLKKILEDEVLPHLGKCYLTKARYLGYMVNKLLMVQFKYAPYDDRDAYENKRVDTPGRLEASLYRQCFNKLVKDMVKGITKEINGNKSNKDVFELITHNNIYKIVKPTIIDGGMKYAHATGNWGVKTNGKGASKVGTAQVLNRLSYQSNISHLRRINSPSDKTNSNGKIVKPRKQHGTQWGYICPAETPEGHPVGLVKNMALSVRVSINSNSMALRALAMSLGVLPLLGTDFASALYMCKVFVNGDWIGNHPDGAQFVKNLRSHKRRGNINIYTGIHWNPLYNTVKLYTDSGRIMRPLYIVDDGNRIRMTKKVLSDLEKYNYDWQFLVCPKTKGLDCEGVIEYVDTIEVNNTLIAMDLDELKRKKAPYLNTYTHCEIHPGLILGAVAGMIPFSDHNQSPRNSYQSSMGKQSMGLYARSFQNRMDTLGYVMNYMETPLTSTRFSKYVNYNEMPCGLNAIVAICSYTGYNQEDSILMNKAAVDRGLFRGTFYRTYKDDEKKIQSSGREEKFAKPIPKYTRGRKPGNYDKLDERGFIRKDEYATSEDIIIGKVLPIKNKIENGHQIYKDCSTSLRMNEKGFIDKIYTDRNADGYRFVKIRTRCERTPIIGDKFAARCGQKGTVGMIFPQEAMPFNEDGITPDIIVNPHAIPSRMTIGMLMETILGKAATLLGGYSDCTPFNKVDVSKIQEILEMNGFDYCGNEILYSGLTGQQMDMKIFMGPTYYQRLKHMVADKMHSRASGPVVQLTRQPAEGRARDGGLRLGEMERDCLISHGTLGFLKERMMDVSDMFQIWICRNCGLFSTVNTEEDIYKCGGCDRYTQFAELKIPYACKLLVQELQGMMITPRFVINDDKHVPSGIQAINKQKMLK